MSKPKTICLLKGGWNGERDVSLQSAKGIYDALIAKGYEVHEYDLSRNLKDLIDFIIDVHPDVVCLNGLHGNGVEDGKIQAIFDILKVPYTGSDVSSSVIAFNKQLSRQVFLDTNIPIAKGVVWHKDQVFFIDGFDRLSAEFGCPFVVKPLCEGSSLGVTIVKSKADLEKAATTWTYGDDVLVESYIPGRELSVAMIGDRALDILELIPTRGFYDYEAKYTEGITVHEMPAKLDDNERNAILSTASNAVRALNVSGVTRVDFRYDESKPRGERHFVLELNTLPGMTPLSIVPEIAAYQGITYEDLCEWMVENPICPQ